MFVAPAQVADEPLERMLCVLRWYISTLRPQFCSRTEMYGSEKKPLNPVLGECFYASWPSEELGETKLTSEQVSHHPPITGR